MIWKIFKVIGILFSVALLLLIGYYIKVYISTENRFNKIYALTPQSINLQSDSAFLAHGKRLSVVKGCVECHGNDLGGKIMNDDFLLGLLVASNLTKGAGGLNDYDDSDWLLALKHGIRKNGKPLIFMPAHEFSLLSEYDMAAIIAYCKQVPRVDRDLPKNDLGPLARVLFDIGKLPLIPAEMVDHSHVLVKEVKAEISVEFGKYLSISCRGCHKESMKGGEALAPGFPVVADITSTGNPGKWTDEEFITTLRTGVTPEGKVLNPEDMPWPMAKEFTDVELKALHLYLNSL